MEKLAPNAFPLNWLLRRRWSPTVFQDRAIEPGHLAQIFEAARWSASCFNEQPWNFVTASRHATPLDFQNLLGCLSPANWAWAKDAPFLMFSVAKRDFSVTGKANRWSWYDSGQALAHLSIEAMDLGIFVHPMAGFAEIKSKECMQVPDTHEVVCAIAMGYGVESPNIPAESRAREDKPRTRNDAASFLHQGRFSADATH
jgi:nitroreductase